MVLLPNSRLLPIPALRESIAPDSIGPLSAHQKNRPTINPPRRSPAHSPPILPLPQDTAPGHTNSPPALLLSHSTHSIDHRPPSVRAFLPYPRSFSSSSLHLPPSTFNLPPSTIHLACTFYLSPCTFHLPPYLLQPCNLAPPPTLEAPHPAPSHVLNHSYCCTIQVFISTFTFTLPTSPCLRHHGGALRCRGVLP